MTFFVIPTRCGSANGVQSLSFCPSSPEVRDTRTVPGFSMPLGIRTPALTPARQALSPASAQELLMFVKSSLPLCCFILIHYLQRPLPKPKSEACTPMHVSGRFACLAITKMFGVALPKKSIWNGLYKAEISHSLGSMELLKESKALWSTGSCFPPSRGVWLISVNHKV